LFVLRCIFINDRQPIASVCSNHGEPIFSALEWEDLRALLQFAVLPVSESDSKRLKCQVEQGWIWSKVIRRRQLVNVFVLSLSSDIEMVCLTPSEQSVLISGICEMLDLLEGTSRWQQKEEGRTNTAERKRALDQCEQALQKCSRLLEQCTTISKSAAVKDFVFLTDVARTQKLVQVIKKKNK
jgi:hypothetical protein